MLLPHEAGPGAAWFRGRAFWMPSWPDEKLAAERASKMEPLAATRARAVATIFADCDFIPFEVRCFSPTVRDAEQVT